jgi:sarcosine/dimethylglycine N-methyltransferase
MGEGRVAAMDDPVSLSVEDIYGGSDDLDVAMDAALAESLDPRGPDALFDLAGELGAGPERLVLDVGCRDGKQAVELARRYECRVVGVEPVEANLLRGNVLLHGVREAEPDVAGRVSLLRGVIERIPLPDGSVDLVWARDMLIHVADLEEGLRECRRVLATGGRILAFQMFATPWLEPGEAARLWPPLGAIPENTDPAYFERCVEEAGLAVVRRDVLSSEWREWNEEQGEGRTSRQLLHTARLLRSRDRFIERFGRAAYEVELGNCLWGVYQMIGKLSPRVYVLAANSA